MKIEKTLSRRAARWVVNGIFILGALGFAASILGGCEFVRGARDEGIRQAPGLLADSAPVLIDKLGDRMASEIGRAVKDAVSTLPPPAPPAGGADNGLLYGAGTLAALLISNAIRGGIRKYGEKRNGGNGE